MTVPYRLGIDIGTNSLGWCVLDLDREGHPKSIRRIGVRIFSNGRDPQSGTSLAVDRRMARGARKRRDRYVDRRADLMRALVRHGLMPADATERKALEALDPYELRWRGLNEKLHPHHLGRAIFHLNQRRGFKSNRKTDKKQKDGDLKGMKGGIGKLREAIDASGAETLGAYLHVAFRKGRTVRGAKDGSVEPHMAVRARPHVVKGKNEYDLYADRAMYEHEYDLLWERQVERGAALPDAARKEIRDIVFFQRPLKPVDPGKCELDPTDNRARLALPISQLSRIWQELNNLRLVDLTQRTFRLTRAQRDRLFAELSRKEKVPFKTMRRLLKFDAELRFNLEDEKRRDGLRGDDTSVKLANKNRFGERWWKFSLNERAEIVEYVLSDKPDDFVRDWLVSRWSIDPETAQNIIDTPLKDGYGRVGAKALSKIVPIMEEQGLVFADAAREAGYHHSDHRREHAEQILPYYGLILNRYTGGSSSEPDDPAEKRYGRIANPTVHVGLNQLRFVINAVCERYGRPREIVVELARDLKLGKEQKDRIKDQQAENQDKNDKRRAKLAELGLPDNGENMMRLRLWEELNPAEPQNRRCPYTGEQISIEKLFSPQVEIEHILPRAKTLDFSPANRTVSMVRANRYKGNNSPFEAFGTSSHGYDWAEIQKRAASFPNNKSWRFADDAMEKFSERGDFLDRQLVDTQYLSRVTREYLSSLYAKNEGSHVWVIPGRLTQMLRGKWGLNRLLSDHNLKNRYDHRHHVIDAFVVGVTDRWMLQQVASAADQIRERLIDDMPDPWEGFRDELRARLEKIVVSHKPDHGTGGKLHEETAYGLIRDPSKEDGATLVYRKPLATLNANEVKRIRDKGLRARVLKAVEPADGNKVELTKALAAFSAETGIRHIRLTKVEEGFVSLTDPRGNPYKALIPGDNHHIEICVLPNGRWFGRGVTMFDANTPADLPSHTSENGRAVMTVHKGDLMKLEHDGKERVMRIVRLRTKAQQLMMAEHIESGNLPDRVKEGSFFWCNVAINQLRTRKARKVTVDFLGRVHDPGPPA